MTARHPWRRAPARRLRYRGRAALASGGAGKIEHISEVLNCSDAALLASLLHYKELTITEIKEFCKTRRNFN